MSDKKEVKEVEICKIRFFEVKQGENEVTKDDFLRRIHSLVESNLSFSVTANHSEETVEMILD